MKADDIHSHLTGKKKTLKFICVFLLQLGLSACPSVSGTYSDSYDNFLMCPTIVNSANPNKLPIGPATTLVEVHMLTTINGETKQARIVQFGASHYFGNGSTCSTLSNAMFKQIKSEDIIDIDQGGNSVLLNINGKTFGTTKFNVVSDASKKRITVNALFDVAVQVTQIETKDKRVSESVKKILTPNNPQEKKIDKESAPASAGEAS